jgi:hypothetical protein
MLWLQEHQHRQPGTSVATAGPARSAIAVVVGSTLMLTATLAALIVYCIGVWSRIRRVRTTQRRGVQ